MSAGFSPSAGLFFQGMGSNEEIRDGEDLPFLCECGDVGCEKCVPMTAEEYRELPSRWPGVALAPGHGPEHLRSGRQRDR